MKKFFIALGALVALACTSAAQGGTWTQTVPFTNDVASSPFRAGGYPVPPGETAPDPGTCRLGDYNSNRSESWIAVRPGTENAVGTSKVFFEGDSTYYDFHVGSYTITNGTPAGNNIVQGYECISTGTQEMPPSWMNNTDPNAAFDTQGRVYQVTLPFNPWWKSLNPQSNIAISFSDDLGRTWVKGNGGEPLEHAPNWSSKALGRVEDKQWVAVNHFPGTANQDHVYAAWTLYNGQTGKIVFAKSEDRGQTFSRAETITEPSQTGTLNEYVYPSVDAAGNVYVAFVSDGRIYVTRSQDDGETWGPFVHVATAGLIGGCCLPNTTFRDGIVEHFAASPTYPGHVYLVYEDWDGRQFDVKFTYSTNGGLTWSDAIRVNDNADYLANDQFQPEVAPGPGGAIAVAFYDRRAACPSGASIRPQDVGRTNFCIDTSVQAYKDNGTTVSPVGNNVRISEFTWDPEQPDQTIGGVEQMACAAHADPCTINAFIGDYFGLAMSAGNIYALMVSTHYPSSVRGDGNRRIYYQQQVLAKVPRSGFGADF
jgi:hypothetical protein